MSLFSPLTSALNQASCHPAPFTLSTLLSTGAGSLAQHRRHLPTQCPRLSPEPLPVIFPSYPDASLSSLPLLWPLILPDAIFPSSPLGCEHPGIRKNVIPVFHVVLGSWQAFRGWGGPGKTWSFRSSASLPVIDGSTSPSTISRLDGPGAPCRAGAPMCQEPFFISSSRSHKSQRARITLFR